jgi:hypothetical protein
MNKTKEEVKRVCLVAYCWSYILEVTGNVQLSSTSYLSAQEFFIRFVDVREESSVGFLFGKVFKIINECQSGVKIVAQSHGSAVVIAGEHNRLQNIRINKKYDTDRRNGSYFVPRNSAECILEV